MLITPFNPKGIGGAETFAQELIKEMGKKFNLDLITYSRPVVAWDEPNIIISIWLAFTLGLRAFFKCLFKKYNIVYCLGAIGLLAGIALKKIFKVKLIGTTLALYEFQKFSRLKWNIFSWIFNSADIIFVEDNLGVADMIHLGVDATKITIFSHWVDLETFKPKKYNFKNFDDINILFVGRPIYKKGKHIILEVEKQLKETDIKARFYYVENVPQSALPIYYQNSDICCIPSCYAEGVSRVVLECAASGCAVLASNYGSLKDLVYKFGICFEPTVENFKKHIIKLVKDKDELDRLKKLSREYAEENFSNKNAEIFMKDV